MISCFSHIYSMEHHSLSYKVWQYFMNMTILNLEEEEEKEGGGGGLM